MRLVYSAETAVAEIAQFYRNYHSSRWLNERFIIRLNQPLSAQTIKQLNSEFSDLCKYADIQQYSRCETEQDDPQFSHLPRLAFVFSGRNHGRLREMLDLINQPESWAKDS
jgi:hypothetical protein